MWQRDNLLRSRMKRLTVTSAKVQESAVLWILHDQSHHCELTATVMRRSAFDKTRPRMLTSNRTRRSQQAELNVHSSLPLVFQIRAADLSQKTPGTAKNLLRKPKRSCSEQRSEDTASSERCSSSGANKRIWASGLSKQNRFR
jgi:hypothetical protein